MFEAALEDFMTRRSVLNFIIYLIFVLDINVSILSILKQHAFCVNQYLFSCL